MSEKITLLIEKLEFDAIIGLLDKERQTPQLVRVWAKTEIKYKKNNFIDYVDIANTIQKTIKTGRFFTVEDALIATTREIAKLSPKITKIELKIFKPEILENAVVGGGIKKILKKTKKL